jgi:hypothetical protein
MKFLVSKAILAMAMLVMGVATLTSAKNSETVALRDLEDFAYWRGLVEGLASVPTEAPVPAPSDIPATPTSSSVAPTTNPPIVATVAPIPPSEAPIRPPVPSPVALTATPVATVSPMAPSTPPVVQIIPTAPPVPSLTNAPTLSPVAASLPTDPPVRPSDVPVTTSAPTSTPVTQITPTTPPVRPSDVPVSVPTLTPIVPVSLPTLTPMVPTATPIAPTVTPAAPSPPPSGGVSTVQTRLTPFTLNNGAEFEDPNSYQSQALLKVEAQEGVETFTDEKLIQYYVLYSIYNATNQVPNAITDMDPRFDGVPFPRWTVETGWDQTNVDPCDGWYGITCDAQGRITTIDLFENLLTGIFPPEVALLALDGPSATGAGNLYRLDLFKNEFLYNDNDSSWVTDLGSNMSKCEINKNSVHHTYPTTFSYSFSFVLHLIATFIVDETSFSGDIPRLPPNLVNFDGSFAFFTGGLTDANFQGINTLNFVDVDGNAFNSTIPKVFGTLPNLQFLYLSDAFLSGDLSFTQGMTAMRELWIDTNPGLSGPIFDYIGSISTLESLSMTFNSLTGTIPSTLGQLPVLLQMWLYSNQLTGPVPSQLGNLKAMKILQVEGNMLTGTMPAEICANTMFPSQILTVLGADCTDPGFACTCCSCCSLAECNEGA